MNINGTIHIREVDRSNSPLHFFDEDLRFKLRILEFSKEEEEVDIINSVSSIFHSLGERDEIEFDNSTLIFNLEPQIISKSFINKKGVWAKLVNEFDLDQTLFDRLTIQDRLNRDMFWGVCQIKLFDNKLTNFIIYTNAFIISGRQPITMDQISELVEMDAGCEERPIYRIMSWVADHNLVACWPSNLIDRSATVYLASRRSQ